MQQQSNQIPGDDHAMFLTAPPGGNVTGHVDMQQNQQSTDPSTMQSHAFPSHDPQQPGLSYAQQQTPQSSQMFIPAGHLQQNSQYVQQKMSQAPQMMQNQSQNQPAPPQTPNAQQSQQPPGLPQRQNSQSGLPNEPAITAAQLQSGMQALGLAGRDLLSLTLRERAMVVAYVYKTEMNTIQNRNLTWSDG